MSEERIAYEELRPGTEVQAGDQHRNTQGRWVEYSMDTSGVPIVGPTTMARRPYKISTILEIGDALANAQRAATQLQHERDEWQRQFAAERSAREAAIAERNNTERLFSEAIMERDKAWNDQRAIQACRDTELQERANAEQALSEERAAHAQTSSDRDRLQDVVSSLYGEPTARQVQDMLRTWATELDWSAGCFDSVAREQIDTIQKTLIAVIERVETMIQPEGGTDGE